jgi:hypothetical protein
LKIWAAGTQGRGGSMFIHGDIDGIQSKIREPNLTFSDAIASREIFGGAYG